MEIVGEEIVVSWKEGRRTATLTVDPLDVADVDRDTVMGWLGGLRTHGLRDWLVLHRMAQEQGATGHLRWTWADHWPGTAYESAVRRNPTGTGNGVLRRLLWLRRVSVAVGGDDLGPLLSVRRERGRRAKDLVLGIELNPELYRSAAATTRKRRRFALLSEGLLTLPADTLALGMLVGIQFHYARDTATKLTRGRLLDWAGIGDGADTPRKRLSAADTMLARHLEALVGVEALGGFDAPTSRSMSAVYLLHAPTWWSSSVLKSRKGRSYLSLSGIPLLVSDRSAPSGGVQAAVAS